MYVPLEGFKGKRKKTIKKPIKKIKKGKALSHLTYGFEEKESLEEDLFPLNYSISSRIRKIKKAFHIGEKPKIIEKKKSVFERLPKKK